MTPNGTATAERAVARPVLADLDLPAGKRVRLHRMLYEHGVGNGTLLILPIDQGIEHGPIDFLPNPPSADPTTSGGWPWRAATTPSRATGGWPGAT